MNKALNSPHETGRKRGLDLLARATRPELEAAWQALADRPGHELLRGPETGLVMVRGRIGGGGAPFNLGETTVSRATVRVADGTVGHGYRLGTDRRAAELAALFDALGQNERHRDFVETSLLAPIEQRQAADAARRENETAATKVDFFTMVRGED
ncbi:alpha-D-ribose 1-methylphosphonate 5-triphosphate synthase subunit PhnG [Neorhizobium galegae]|uniref:phosphonate C-P lyase system protein PhnG n=1 Tax=Rhizobium/Agrobacterium group TaxID=227290 RepID=UPI001AE3D925|nr:phosphonate C-P lyase system protein PhnG [Neorhizobium galegae]MBP2550888.1 alpha-D-ribose 1-methylphosphonate 5-triphosphate synthase subunit PhnG [Neorhizobium galegae]